jgi:hypothetical protein
MIFRWHTSGFSVTCDLLLYQFKCETAYHQRWEVENTIDEFKVHLLERKTHIRSQRPREVVQEIYGLLLGHWAVRSLIC